MPTCAFAISTTESRSDWAELLKAANGFVSCACTLVTGVHKSAVVPSTIAMREQRFRDDELIQSGAKGAEQDAHSRADGGRGQQCH